VQELLSHVLRATKERLEAQGVDVNGGAVQDIHNGTVLMELGGAKSGRLASLDAGSVPLLLSTPSRDTQR
jgi:acetyl-CoA acyltransferase 1